MSRKTVYSGTVIGTLRQADVELAQRRLIGKVSPPQRSRFYYRWRSECQAVLSIAQKRIIVLRLSQGLRAKDQTSRSNR